MVGGNKSQRHEGGGGVLGLCWDFVSMTFNIKAFTVKSRRDSVEGDWT